MQINLDFISSFLPAIEHFSLMGYWLIFLIAFLESLAFIGFIIPGTLVIIFFGFLISKGILDFGDAIWFAALGAVMGDSLSYYLGSHADKFFRPDSKVFKSPYLERGKKFFHDHGGKSVFIGRFFGPIRPIIPFVAGLLKMNERNFILWNVSSAILWATSLLLIGFFFGHIWIAI